MGTLLIGLSFPGGFPLDPLKLTSGSGQAHASKHAVSHSTSACIRSNRHHGQTRTAGTDRHVHTDGHAEIRPSALLTTQLHENKINIFDPPLGVPGSWAMLNGIVSNSHCWEWFGAREMTLFGSHVGPHIPNNGYFEAYEGT